MACSPDNNAVGGSASPSRRSKRAGVLIILVINGTQFDRLVDLSMMIVCPLAPGKLNPNWFPLKPKNPSLAIICGGGIGEVERDHRVGDAANGGPMPIVFNFAFLIFNSASPPLIFILRANNTFLPNRVGRRPMQPGAARSKVENHQCLQACGRAGGTVLRDARTPPETGFGQKQNFGTPEFLFFRRITIFRVPVLFSRRRGGGLAVGPHWQPATYEAGAL